MVLSVSHVNIGLTRITHRTAAALTRHSKDGRFESIIIDPSGEGFTVSRVSVPGLQGRPDDVRRVESTTASSHADLGDAVKRVSGGDPQPMVFMAQQLPHGSSEAGQWVWYDPDCNVERGDKGKPVQEQFTQRAA